MAKILLVEDDLTSSELLSNYLIECGFEIVSVFNAIDGLDRVKHEKFDLVLLDINLPDFDGFEFLKGIRNKISVAVIVISAYDEIQKKLLAFKYGASDYMVKPIDLAELEARIWVQLGKNSKIKDKPEKKIFEIKDSAIFFKQKKLDLTYVEFKILSILIKNRNKTISRKSLVSLLSSISSPRSLDNHIKNIRKKLGDNGKSAKYIRTEYGVGYRLDCLHI